MPTKLKALTGINVGTIFDAMEIGAADTLLQSLRWNVDRPDSFYSTSAGKAQSDEVDECWARNKGDGFWIDGIGRVMEGVDWQDLHTPFDKKDREIKVGDVIVYAMQNLTVSELKVEKLVLKNRTMTLHGTDLHTGKKTKNSYPERCLNVSP